jgi:integrase
MKAGREHRVPLSGAAVDILRAQNEKRGKNPRIFPGARPRRPLGVMAFTEAMARIGVGEATVHGFRSAFRDWAGDETTFQREVAEAALAHVVGDTTEAAYRRGDALEKRRELMEAWANYLSAEPSDKVVPFTAGRKRTSS